MVAGAGDTPWRPPTRPTVRLVVGGLYRGHSTYIRSSLGPGDRSGGRIAFKRAYKLSCAPSESGQGQPSGFKLLYCPMAARGMEIEPAVPRTKFLGGTSHIPGFKSRVAPGAGLHGISHGGVLRKVGDLQGNSLSIFYILARNFSDNRIPGQS